MADFFTWDASRSLQWVRETRWGGGATPDDAIEAVADEEVDGAFLEENDANAPEIWTELGFTEAQAEVLANDVAWMVSGGAGTRPSHGDAAGAKHLAHALCTAATQVQPNCCGECQWRDCWACSCWPMVGRAHGGRWSPTWLCRRESTVVQFDPPDLLQ